MPNNECSVRIEIICTEDKMDPKVMLSAICSLMITACDAIEEAHPGFCPLDLAQPDGISEAAAEVCSLSGRLIGAIHGYLDATDESGEVELELRKVAA